MYIPQIYLLPIFFIDALKTISNSRKPDQI